MSCFVYLVTRGQYSAYTILGVFTTRYLANKYIKKYHTPMDEYREVRVEPWQLNELVPPMKLGLHPYLVRVSRDTKEVIECGLRDNFPLYEDQDPGIDCNKDYHITVLAKDASHAAKIGKDKVMDYLFIKEGI